MNDCIGNFFLKEGMRHVHLFDRVFMHFYDICYARDCVQREPRKEVSLVLALHPTDHQHINPFVLVKKNIIVASIAMQ